MPCCFISPIQVFFHGHWVVPGHLRYLAVVISSMDPHAFLMKVQDGAKGDVLAKGVQVRKVHIFAMEDVAGCCRRKVPVSANVIIIVADRYNETAKATVPTAATHVLKFLKLI